MRGRRRFFESVQGTWLKLNLWLLSPWKDLRRPVLRRDQIQPALLAIDREVKDRGDVPHILTGPIWVDSAEPGDVLGS